MEMTVAILTATSLFLGLGSLIQARTIKQIQRRLDYLEAHVPWDGRSVPPR